MTAPLPPPTAGSASTPGPEPAAPPDPDPAPAAPPAPAQVVATRRPRGAVGAVITLGGAVTAGVGAFATWFSIGELDIDGFTELGDEGTATTGSVVLALAIVLAGVALVTLIGRRVVPVALVGAAAGVTTIVVAVLRRADLGEAADRYTGLVEVGPASVIVMVGGAVATFGSLLVLVVRRRR